MQQIAKEINFSESTFILSNTKKDNGYDVRIFTPNEEIPFAGHPTLGTAYVIQNEILERPCDRLILNYKAGQIPVSFNNIGIIVFSPEAYNSENDLNVRDFVDYYGIPEDAATGSSNGCLASYLIKYRYFKSREIDVRVEQGYEINRPSLLFLKASDDGGRISIYVGGKVEKIAQGEWFL